MTIPWKIDTTRKRWTMRSLSLRHIFALVFAVHVLSGQIANSGPEQQRAGSGDTEEQAWAKALPKDVYPESGNRLPLVKREELDEFGKQRYDYATALPGPQRGAHLRGPITIMLHSPFLAEHEAAISQYLRGKSNPNMTPRLAELMVLVEARENGNQWQWTEHEFLAQKEGLEQKIIDTVKYRKPLTGLGEKEALIIQLGRETLGQHKLSSDTFARALKVFGKQGVVDIVSLMAYYSGQNVLLTAFDQQLRPGRVPGMPMP